MNHRERILAAIQHQRIDRFPTDMWATHEVYQNLFAYFGVDNQIDLFDRMDIDGIIGITPVYIGPEKKTLEHPDLGKLRLDEWGMGYKPQLYESGVYDEQVYFPLAQAETVADLESYPWPSPDWYDYSVLSKAAERGQGRAIECGYTAIFYWHNRLRGLELSLTDPLLKPDFTHHLIDKLSDFFQEYHIRCFEALPGRIDTTEVTDDFGSQSGLLISPRIFQSFYRQAMQRAIDLARSYHIHVFHHDDGDLRPLLNQLVNMGIDILNPIQWRCGNWDLAEMKREFGSRICFHGGVDNQETLPFGAPMEVKQQVRMLKRTLGSDGTGLIIAPCHNLQAVTPVENILALYDEAHKGDV